MKDFNGKTQNVHQYSYFALGFNYYDGENMYSVFVLNIVTGYQNDYGKPA